MKGCAQLHAHCFDRSAHMLFVQFDALHGVRPCRGPIAGLEVLRGPARDVREFRVVVFEALSQLGGQRHRPGLGTHADRVNCSGGSHVRLRSTTGLKLCLLRTALHGARGELPGCNRRLHGVEVTRAHEGLVARGAIAVGFAGELALLEPGITEHAFGAIGRRQFEHRQIERVPSRERDELEAVAQRRQAFAPATHLVGAQFRLPVEGRRAVVGQQLARIPGVDAFREAAGFLDVGLGGLAPDQVGVRRIGQASGDRLFDAVLHVEEPLGAALTGQERLIARVVIGGQQVRGLRVGACDQDGRHTRHVGGQACRHQLVDGFVGGYQHLAAHVAAFLGGGELILEMHAGRAGANHRLGEFKGIQVAAETGLGIRDDGRQPVDAALAARAHGSDPCAAAHC